MKLVDLQRKAAGGYAHGDGGGTCFDPETGQPVTHACGDALEHFVAIELAETFEPDATDQDQLHSARILLQNAIQDLEGAIEALE